MKKFIAVVCLMIMGCDLPDSQKPENNLSEIRYWKDTRTDLCFASSGGIHTNYFSFTLVPCDSVVKFLKNAGK